MTKVTIKKNIVLAGLMLAVIIGMASCAKKGALNDGRIPPVKSVKLDDPILSELFAQVQAAPDMQLWYDQSLSPEVADVHKVTSQEIFGGTLTPQAAAQKLQDAQAAYLKQQKK